MIGLDLGTTGVAATLCDLTAGKVLAVESLVHGADISAPPCYAQDAARLLGAAKTLLRKLLGDFKHVAAIGVSSQMHGVVYTDSDANALSALYSWQDARGEQATDDGSYADAFFARTGERVPSGYGAMSHFINLQEGLVPANATALCSIGDLLVMQLCGLRHPEQDASLAHSFGLYDAAQHRFAHAAWAQLGDTRLLPHVHAQARFVGSYQGIPVLSALGDNQASFIGSVADLHRSGLLNIGTSGQLSALGPPGLAVQRVDPRPFPTGEVLYVGATLLGGAAYGPLIGLLQSISQRLLGKPLEDPWPFLEVDENFSTPIIVDTRFAGSRQNPEHRGAITHIGAHDLSFEALTLAFAQGIVRELYRFWEKDFLPHGIAQNIRYLTASGNALRHNATLQRSAKARFALPLAFSEHREEAAVGAAILAAATLAQEPLAAVSRRLLTANAP